MYLQRAFGRPEESLPPPLKLLPSWGEDWEAEALEQLATALESQATISHAQAVRYLTRTAPEVLYVYLPGSEPDRQQITKLRKAFPEIVLFVLTTVDLGEDPPQVSPRSGVRYLLPALPEGQEDSIIEEYEDACFILNNRKKPAG